MVDSFECVKMHGPTNPKWISKFLRVLYLWNLELCSRDWQYFLIKQVTSNIYKEANVRIFNFLNNCLQDVLELTPTFDLVTLGSTVTCYLRHCCSVSCTKLRHSCWWIVLLYCAILLLYYAILTFSFCIVFFCLLNLYTIINSSIILV